MERLPKTIHLNDFNKIPRNLLSATLPEVSISTGPQMKALQLVEQTRTVQELARKHALAAQNAQAIQANKKLRSIDFGKGDLVYVSKKGMRTEAPSTKLDSQWAGPWKIVEERGHSFVLDTPPYVKGTKLSHADRLREADDHPVPQQVSPPEPPEEIDGEPEWEIERISASRLSGKQKVLQYQVAWRGHDPDDMWYQAGNLKNAVTALESFHRE